MMTEKNTHISPLTLNVKLVERETAFSFMSRLADRNGVSSRLLGLDYDIPFASIIDGDPEAISTLAALGGVDPLLLSKWTPFRQSGSCHSMCGETFNGRMVRNPVMKACPACLKEDIDCHTSTSGQGMAYRGHWMVKHVLLCPKHSHPLVDIWRENNLYSRYDIAHRMADHAQAIIQKDIEYNKREPTDYDEWIDNRLVSGPGTGWLDQFALHASATFCFLLGYALLRLQLSAPSSVLKQDRWAIYQTGYAVASNGEAAVREALKKLQQLTATPQQGPKGTFPLLYERLSNEYATNVEFQPFRDILRSHILETWPLGVGDEVMGEPVEARVYHSVRTAAKETGVDQRRLRKLLEAQDLIAKDLPDSWALFDAASTTSLLSRLTTFLSAKEFAESLSMSRSQFDILVADGILRPALIDADTKHVWNPKDGQDFLTGLFSGAESLIQAQHGWEHISKSAMRLKIRPGDIIRSIRENHMLRVGNHADYDGYAALYVNHDQLAALFGAKAPDAYSIELFAKSIGARQLPAFKRLIVNGHTPSTKLKNPRTNATQTYITPLDAEAFHAKFYTLRNMSKHFNMTWQNLAAQLGQAGIKPFSPDGEHYGKIYLKEQVDQCFQRSHQSSMEEKI